MPPHHVWLFFFPFLIVSGQIYLHIPVSTRLREITRSQITPCWKDFVFCKWSCERSWWEPLRHTASEQLPFSFPAKRTRCARWCPVLAGRKSGRKGTEKLFVPQATQSISPERHSLQAFLGRKVRNSAENVRLCIYMETITGLLYNRIQNHHTIEERKKTRFWMCFVTVQGGSGPVPVPSHPSTCGFFSH